MQKGFPFGHAGLLDDSISGTAGVRLQEIDVNNTSMMAL